MASQICHIIYAKKYFDRVEAGEISGFPKIKKEEFFLGCNFPDIRQVDKNIKRRDTHLKFYPLDLNFSDLSSFEAGWKFHLYCDMRREEILNKYKFYSLKKTIAFYGRGAKFLEDRLFYSKYNNWEKLVNYYNNPPFPNNLPVKKEGFDFWYAILAKYMEKKPEIKTIEIFLNKLALPNKEGIIVNISEIENNLKAIEILKKVEEEII